jgi:hypothetical protein
MTVTLHDVMMFFSLEIKGHPVIGSAISEGCHRRVEEFLGTPPPAPQGKEARRGHVSGVSLHWFWERFVECPQDADEGTITYYCRVWVLNLFASVLFPNATGDNALWMYIHRMSDWDDAGARMCRDEIGRKRSKNALTFPIKFLLGNGTEMIRSKTIPIMINQYIRNEVIESKICRYRSITVPQIENTETMNGYICNMFTTK